MAALSFPTNVDFERNQLIRAALELVAGADTTPVTGQIQFTNAAPTGGLPAWSVIVRDGDTTPSWRVLGAINKAQTVTGFWTFFNTLKSDGSAAADGDAPFGIDVKRTGVVINLSADRLDGFDLHLPRADGMSAPNADKVPLYWTAGRLAVGDPVNPYDAVNKKTLEAAQQGITYTDPVKYASVSRLNGNRSGNVITGVGTTVLSVDGVNVATSDRILVRDQQTGGTAVDNGIYVVTNPGVAGSQAWILTRATDADATAELKVGLTVFVTAGATQANSQFTCNAAGTINTDPNTWTLTSKVSGYTAGRGIVITGQVIDFAKSTPYSAGSIFYSSDASTMSELVSPTFGVNRFLTTMGGGAVPAWATISWGDVSGKPTNIVTGTGSVNRHSRWGSAASTLENSRVIDDDAGLSVLGVRLDNIPNSDTNSTIGLGKALSPWAWIYANSVRTLPITGTQLQTVLGFSSADAAAMKEVRTYTGNDVTAWLGLSDINTRFAAATTTLTISGTAGAVEVAPATAQSLAANRSWAITLDFTTLDTRWVTVAGVQTITGFKTFQATSAATIMTAWRVQGETEPSLAITADGELQFGDGNLNSVGRGKLRYSVGSMEFSILPVEFGSGSTIAIHTAVTEAGAPITLLGLGTGDLVRKVSGSELYTFIGQPALTKYAVGYGDANGKLSLGDPSKLRWDYDNTRFGINQGAPATTFDVVGIGSIGTITYYNAVNTGSRASNAGILGNVDDKSTSAADWVNRSFTVLNIGLTKSGSAVGDAAAITYAAFIRTTISDGTVPNVIGTFNTTAIGGDTGKLPTVATAYGFRSGFISAAGSLGSLGTMVHFYCSDYPAPFAAITTHVGFSCGNLSAVTNVRGLQLSIAKAGTGTIRHNIFSNSDADNYLLGFLGLGTSSPTARLEFVAGTTSIAPMRFASGGALQGYQVMLTTPLAGMVESDLTTVNLRSRLYYTDGLPVRRGLAFFDDVNFTNDPNAENAGCVNFYSATNGNHFSISNLTGIVLGTLDFSVVIRCRYPATPLAATCLMALTYMANGGGGGAHDWLIQYSSGALVVTIRDPAGSINGRAWTVPAANMAQYYGRVVDIAVVRTAGVVSIWVNGINVTPTPTGTAYEALPVCNGQLPIYFHVGSMHNTAPCWGERVYSARLFNKALSGADLLDLTRHGVHEQDKWSATPIVYSSVGKWGTGVDGWFGSSATVAFGQAIGGKTDVLKVTATATSYVLAGKTTLTRYKRYRMEFNYYIPTANVGAKRIQTAFFNSNANRVTQPVPTYDAWQAMTVDSGLDQNTSGSASTIEFDFASAAGAWAGPITVGDAIYFDSVKITQLGCLVDLDFGRVMGNIVHDWSGRYHGVLDPAGIYEIVRPFHTSVSISGGTGTDNGIEIATGLRKYSKRFEISAAGTANIDHNLGTKNVTVEVWDDPNIPATPEALPQQKVECYVEMPTANRVTLMVSNMRVTPRKLRIVIVG